MKSYATVCECVCGACALDVATFRSVVYNEGVFVEFTPCSTSDADGDVSGTTAQCITIVISVKDAVVVYFA